MCNAILEKYHMSICNANVEEYPMSILLLVTTGRRHNVTENLPQNYQRLVRANNLMINTGRYANQISSFVLHATYRPNRPT